MALGLSGGAEQVLIKYNPKLAARKDTNAKATGAKGSGAAVASSSLKLDDAVSLTGTDTAVKPESFLDQLGSLFNDMLAMVGLSSSEQKVGDKEEESGGNEQDEGASDESLERMMLASVPAAGSSLMYEIDFLASYLDQIDKICENLSKMFSSTERSAMSEAEIEERIAEKKEELEKLAKKIYFASQEAEKVHETMQQIHAVLSSISSGAGDPQAKLAHAAELMKKLKSGITALVFVSYEINKHIENLEDLGAAGAQVDQLSKISAKLTKAIEKCDDSYRNLQNQLAAA